MQLRSALNGCHSTPRPNVIVYLFRKKHPHGFSIEKLFNVLYHYMQQRMTVQRMEMPSGTSGVWSALKNAWYVRQHLHTGVLHITGDVHYGALFTPFTRTLITVHDCGMLQRGEGLKRLILWLLWFRLPMTFASAITVISEQTKKELLSVIKLPSHKVHVIPNFVDPQFRHSLRAFNQAKPRVLHIGTRDNKNLQRVIRAVAGLPMLLVIVGPLSDAQIRLLVEYGIAYENHPAPEEPALVALYESADLISFPSTFEGFGMPILEGQAVGRAVLTSDREPMRSVSGGAALLVDPESVTAIRAGFLKLLHDAALRDQLVSKGLDNVRDYSLSSVAQQYQRLYEQLNV